MKSGILDLEGQLQETSPNDLMSSYEEWMTPISQVWPIEGNYLLTEEDIQFSENPSFICKEGIVEGNSTTLDRKRKQHPQAASEEKMEKRRETNRLAAQKSRERRNSYVKNLEEQLRSMTAELASLRKQNAALLQENMALKSSQSQAPVLRSSAARETQGAPLNPLQEQCSPRLRAAIEEQAKAELSHSIKKDSAISGSTLSKTKGFC